MGTFRYIVTNFNWEAVPSSRQYFEWKEKLEDYPEINIDNNKDSFKEILIDFGKMLLVVYLVHIISLSIGFLLEDYILGSVLKIIGAIAAFAFFILLLKGFYELPSKRKYLKDRKLYYFTIRKAILETENYNEFLESIKYVQYFGRY